MIPRPASDEYAPYYGPYVARVPDGDILRQLETQHRETQALLGEIGEERGGFRYASDKWSVKQVIGHLTDTERMFSYRALVFARSDVTPQPGMEQNDWARVGEHDARQLADVASEFASVRAATLSLFRGFSDTMWGRTGVANNVEFSTRALAYIVAGHELHHLGVVRERYLG